MRKAETYGGPRAVSAERAEGGVGGVGRVGGFYRLVCGFSFFCFFFFFSPFFLSGEKEKHEVVGATNWNRRETTAKWNPAIWVLPLGEAKGKPPHCGSPGHGRGKSLGFRLLLFGWDDK